MYGVPTDLDLTYLHGATLIQVCLGEYQLQFHFHPRGSIYVEGRWELLDATGSRIDGWRDRFNRPRDASGPQYQVHRILGQKVIGTEVSAPESCAFRFEKNDVLRFFDDSEQYESFQIDDVFI